MRVWNDEDFTFYPYQAGIEANPFIKKVQMVSYAVIPEKR